jgi:hypothetical protein
MRCTRVLVVVLAMLLLPAQALAGTASVVDIDVERLGPGQSLRYLAAPGEANDLRVVGADDRHFTLHDPVGITPGPGCSAVDGATVVCTLAPDLEQLGPTLRLGDAGDRATLAVSVCAVYAGRGQDDVRLTGISSCDVRGGAGDDRLAGGDGTASLDGGHGDDQLTGGAGNDGLGGGAGSDVIRGGGGRDSVGYVDRRRPLSVSLDGRANDGERGEHDLVAPDVENVTGGSADDRITGSAAANQLTGGAGSDVIRGGAGDDRLEGGIPYLRQSRAQDRDHGTRERLSAGREAAAARRPVRPPEARRARQAGGGGDLQGSAGPAGCAAPAADPHLGPLLLVSRRAGRPGCRRRRA